MPTLSRHPGGSSSRPRHLLAAALSLAVVTLVVADDTVSVLPADETLTIMRGETPVLVYHTAQVPPPEDVSPVYYRSGFIHPLRAPSGGVVSGMHPEDHFHHLGLWHAWVKTEYDGHHPDFWNLGQITGRVRYEETKEVRDAGFSVAQAQVAHLDGAEAKPTVILSEILSVDVAFVDGANVIDYNITQTNVTDKPLVLPAYRYGGGVAYRAPHSWDMNNSDYLTSEGKNRKNSHATRARWVAMFGPAEGGGGEQATVAVLCHPENHDAPQRIRTWDSGKIFLNYVPIQETGWSIEPGQTVDLRYRIVIFDGKVEAGSIEERYEAYVDL